VYATVVLTTSTATKGHSHESPGRPGPPVHDRLGRQRAAPAQFKGTFAKIGVKNLRWTNYASVTAKTSAQRDQMLQRTEQAFAAL
jgi:hypothetical protein